MLKLKQVEATNFLSYKVLTLKLSDLGLTLINGVNNAASEFNSNGSGKSSMLSTVPYAIFGKTLTGEKSDEVINRNQKKDCAVKLTFEDTEADTTYRVERYRKDTKHKNQVLLFANDADITEATTAKTNAKIEQIFGLDYATYVTGIHVGQSDVPMFANASDAEKKNILENIAELGIYKIAHDVADKKAKELQGKQQELTYHIEAAQLVLEDYQDAAKKQAEERARQQGKLESLSQAVDQAQQDYDRLTPKIANELSMAMAKLDSLKQASANYYQLHSKLTELQNTYNTYNNTAYQKEYETHSINEDLQNLADQYRSYESTATCPTCGAPLDAQHKQAELKRIGDLGRAKKDILAETTKVYEKARHLSEDAQVQIDQVKEKMEADQELVQEVSTASNEVNRLNNQQSELTRKLTQAQRDLTFVQQNLGQQKDYQENIDDKLKAIEDYQNTYNKIDKQIETYKTVASKVFSNSGVRSYVLQAITPYLNEHTNKYLSVLTGSTITANISTQTTNKKGEIKDKFDIGLQDDSGKDISYKGASTGERKRVDLAISFAIRDLIMTQSNTALNFAVYDECFDGMDSIGMEHIIDLLNQEVQEVGTIFVITHNENLKSLFNKQLTVTKDTEGYSTINNENTI